LDADGVRRAFVLSIAYLMAPDAYGTVGADARAMSNGAFQ